MDVAVYKPREDVIVESFFGYFNPLNKAVKCDFSGVISDNSSHLIEPYFSHKSSISFRYWLDYQKHIKYIYQIFSEYCQISIDIIWYKYMHIKKV